MLITPELIAEALDGEVEYALITAPAPGRRPKDRSLRVIVYMEPWVDYEFIDTDAKTAETFFDHLMSRLDRDYGMRSPEDGH